MRLVPAPHPNEVRRPVAYDGQAWDVAAEVDETAERLGDAD
jgi:hypothetical protein